MQSGIRRFLHLETRENEENSNINRKDRLHLTCSHEARHPKLSQQHLLSDIELKDFEENFYEQRDFDIEVVTGPVTSPTSIQPPLAPRMRRKAKTDESFDGVVELSTFEAANDKTPSLPPKSNKNLNHVTTIYQDQPSIVTASGSMPLRPVNSVAPLQNLPSTHMIRAAQTELRSNRNLPLTHPKPKPGQKKMPPDLPPKKKPPELPPKKKPPALPPKQRRYRSNNHSPQHSQKSPLIYSNTHADVQETGFINNEAIKAPFAVTGKYFDPVPTLAAHKNHMTSWMITNPSTADTEQMHPCFHPKPCSQDFETASPKGTFPDHSPTKLLPDQLQRLHEIFQVQSPMTQRRSTDQRTSGSKQIEGSEILGNRFVESEATVYKDSRLLPDRPMPRRSSEAMILRAELYTRRKVTHKDSMQKTRKNVLLAMLLLSMEAEYPPEFYDALFASSDFAEIIKRGLSRDDIVSILAESSD